MPTIEGFDVVLLIDKCWLGRLDLDYEDDIAFIEQERGSTSIKRRHVTDDFYAAAES